MEQIELKDYQKDVLGALRGFISEWLRSPSVSEAYVRHWAANGIDIEDEASHKGILQSYNDTMVPGIPNVTVKVPTAGGKTFIACAALNEVFSQLPIGIPHVVTWFVPTDAILQQTLRNLRDTHHPYRQRIDTDFHHAVNVIDKEEALMSKGLSPSEIQEQLTILVLSVQSFASDNSDYLRVRRQNGAFVEYLNQSTFRSHRLNTAEMPSLLQVLSFLKPVVIIDESHKFEHSDLRQDLQRELSPRFILNLTATPRKRSNIICFVDSFRLKKENMVKLPVVVYNCKSSDEVISDAITLRNSLEFKAEQLYKEGGDYIRPIVLLQAQPNTGKEAETFKNLKEKLLMSPDVSKEQVAIKTAEINELRGVDLLSQDCPIRYIITVNALNEGWDCPFAYILASVANRTSTVEVEQIIGRILRQPYARRQGAGVLNASYVFTNSDYFQTTVNAIVESLNNAGYSSKDCQITENSELHEKERVDSRKSSEQNDTGQAHFQSQYDTYENEQPNDYMLHESVGEYNKTPEDVAQKMEASAEQGDQQMNEEAKADNNTSTIINSDMQEKTEMLEIYKKEAMSMAFPVFCIKVQPDAFGQLSEERLTKMALTAGFRLSLQDKNINFDETSAEAIKLDLYKIDKDEHRIAQFKLEQHERQFINETFENYKDKGSKLNALVKIIVRNLERLDEVVGHNELMTYVKDILKMKSTKELKSLYTSSITTTEKFKRKIEALINQHRHQIFLHWLQTEKIYLSTAERICYRFPQKEKVIRTAVGLQKGLYRKEPFVNGLEEKVIKRIMVEDNVLFWHRNDENTGFCINGFIYHYPDFIVRLRSGKTLLIETKGPQYKGTQECKDRIDLGRCWVEKAGKDYRYYMVFESQPMEGAVSVEQLIDIIQNL